jgi:hypothetical protein
MPFAPGLVEDGGRSRGLMPNPDATEPIVATWTGEGAQIRRARRVAARRSALAASGMLKSVAAFNPPSAAKKPA